MHVWLRHRKGVIACFWRSSSYVILCCIHLGISKQLVDVLQDASRYFSEHVLSCKLYGRLPPGVPEIKQYIKDVIDYSSKNVICIINVNVCKISSVGYTADNIKPGLLIIKLKLSEVSKHFADNLVLHSLDKSSVYS